MALLGSIKGFLAEKSGLEAKNKLIGVRRREMNAAEAGVWAVERKLGELKGWGPETKATRAALQEELAAAKARFSEAGRAFMAAGGNHLNGGRHAKDGND